MKRIYRKCQQKGFTPQHVAEVGVYLPNTSNVVDFAERGMQTTLVEAHPAYVKEIEIYFKNYPNVTLHPVAIADTPGQIRIVTRGASTYVEHISHPPSVVNDGYQMDERDVVTVPAERFDEIDDGTINLLSIDIEGSEWFVIKHLKSRPAVISVETHGKLYTNPYLPEIAAWMETNGYQPWYKDKSDTVYMKLSALTRTPAEKTALYFKNVQLTLRTKKSRVKQVVRRFLSSE